ncbi:MAG: hypothetical protein AAB634_01140 [Patescibacteria group bacterium]
MKRNFIAFLCVIVIGILPKPLLAAGFFESAFLSAFRNVQERVEDARNAVLRFFGVRERAREEPVLALSPLGEPKEFLVGAEREIQWTYANARESVSRVYLVPEAKPRVLLLFLPAKRGVAGADRYSFSARFQPGNYTLQVCNGDICDSTEPFSIAFPPPPEPPAPSPELVPTSTLITTSTPTPTSTPTSTLISPATP